MLVEAAEVGHLNVIRWVIERDWDDEALLTEGSDVEDPDNRLAVTTAIDRQTSLGGGASLAIHAAAINGHLDIARYLYARADKPLDHAEEWKEKTRLSKRKSP
ncbi:hypothetical protein PHYPSEUDO_010883 [Phytophthora pseudosyringae]|uniref:Ankyrin repeat protein n=1 Tax=Phytophthora pseudosyringae TaxID=221518 RepID=A0A8T1VCL8_9STRA|nr:hypothetical protein PHYPSEUDO_010883 [Phytophthora pseudosyringae]